MRSTEVRPRAGLALVLLLAAGCTISSVPEPTPPPTSSPTPAAASPSRDVREATPTPSAEPSHAGLVLPAPARVLGAATLLAAMRDSRRPGGVPDEIETDAIASAVADAIWAFGGRPWATSAVGASCGPATCTLEVAGAAAGAQGDDVWVFTVTPDSGSVDVVDADLRSLPTELLVPLDALARALDPDGSLDGLILASARWLPPPDVGRFVLSYRSGGEEGSCGVDLTLDAAAAVIVARDAFGC